MIKHTTTVITWLCMTMYSPGEGHDFKLNLNAHKEKLMREALFLADSTDVTKTITLVIHARVLGESAAYNICHLCFNTILSCKY